MLLVPAAWSIAEEIRESSVGMPARIEQIVLPGTKLEARPIESRELPVVVRVVAAYPHGTAFRYDLEYYGLDPGHYDLRDYLRRADGSSTSDLPELPIDVVSLLPAGQIVPNELSSGRMPRIGGYRIVLFVATAAWVLALAAILLVRRRTRSHAVQTPRRRLSLAERLGPLVAAAVDGRLSAEERGEIERLLLSYWRRRLNLDGLDPLAAVAALRQHEQAGALLRQIETWLHKPEGANEVDLAAILEPYRELPAEPDRVDPAPANHLQATGGGGRL